MSREAAAVGSISRIKGGASWDYVLLAAPVLLVVMLMEDPFIITAPGVRSLDKYPPQGWVPHWARESGVAPGLGAESGVCWTAASVSMCPFIGARKHTRSICSPLH